MPSPLSESGATDSIVRLRGIGKRFGSGMTALDAIDLDIGRGEFLSLLGPSGCGKTTTLRLLSGLETPDEGEITLGGRCLAAPRRGVLVPTFHPAFLLRNPGQEFKRMAWDDLKLARREITVDESVLRTQNLAVFL